MEKIKFSAQVVSARNKWLKLAANETMETVLEFLQSKYENEENSNRRLGNLAAQTWIIRKRLEHMPTHPETTVGVFLEGSEKNKPQTITQAIADNPDTEVHVKLETLKVDQDEASLIVIHINEEVKINDMRFFSGSKVEVSKEDAEKLVQAGKAVIHEE